MASEYRRIPSLASTAHLHVPCAAAELWQQPEQEPLHPSHLGQLLNLKCEQLQVLVCAQCSTESALIVDGAQEAALHAALAAAAEWPIINAQDAPTMPAEQRKPSDPPVSAGEATHQAAAAAASDAQQPVQQAQGGVSPDAAVTRGAAPGASPGPGGAGQPATAWRKHVETIPPGGCWLCRACSLEMDALQQAEQAGQGPQPARPPWRRQINATILKRVLNIKRKHLAQCFGWDAATQAAPRMSIHLGDRMLREGTAGVMGFNKEGRDGFPFKTRWLGMLLDALGAQLGDSLVLQHRFTTAAGVMHVAASLARAQPGSTTANAAAFTPPKAGQQAAQPAPAPQQAVQPTAHVPLEARQAAQQAAQAPPAVQQAAQPVVQPSWTPSDLANYTAGCNSDFLSTSSDARHNSAAEEQQAGEEMEQQGRQKRRRVEPAGPWEAAAAATDAVLPGAFQAPAAALAEPSQLGPAPRAQQSDAAATAIGGDGLPVAPGAQAVAAAVPAVPAAPPEAASGAAQAAFVEGRTRFTSLCGRKYVYEKAMRTHALTCPTCQGLARQGQVQRRPSGLAGVAGSGAALDTLCDAAEMELDAGQAGSESREHAAAASEGGQAPAGMAGTQNSPMGAVPGPAPQSQWQPAAPRPQGQAAAAAAEGGKAAAGKAGTQSIPMGGMSGPDPQLQGKAAAAHALEQTAQPQASASASLLSQTTQAAAHTVPSQQPTMPAKPTVPAAQQILALPTTDTLRKRLQHTPVDGATVEAYLAEWAALPPSVQAGEWQVLKEYIKTDDIASLEVHLRAMI